MNHPDDAKAPDNVVPLPALGVWEAVSVRVPPPRPRIPAGQYWAVSVTLETRQQFDRRIVEINFDVFEGDPGTSMVIARVPLFARLPPRGDRLSANSRLAVMLHMLGQVRGDRVRRESLDILRNKLWRVLVGDTAQDSSGKLEGTEIAPYTVI